MYNNYHCINYKIYFLINMFEDINIDTIFLINLVKLDIIWLLWESNFIGKFNDIYGFK